MNKITSEQFADLIVEINSEIALENEENITFINEAFVLLNLPVENINKCSLGTYPYHYFPKCYTLQSISSLEKSGIPSVQNTKSLALFGEGVLIGIIDTGIDYQHEAFINENKTKIVSIWDQSIKNRNQQSNTVLYGTEYSRDMINEALHSEKPLDIVPSVDELGHGTMIAGIIAGNAKRESDFSGVVPKAELVVVKLKQAKKITREIFAISNDAVCFQESDILFAINYITLIAKQSQKPIAICIAVGTSQGSHDNRGTLNAYSSYVTDNQGVVMVISAGNEGNARRHYFGKIDVTNKSNIMELQVGKDEQGFSMEIWQSTPHRLSVEIKSPSGEIIPAILPSFNECIRKSLIFERTIIYINNILSEAITGDHLILVRLEYPTQGIWSLKLTNIDGLVSEFHSWLPSGNLISDETFFLNVNQNTTITSPGNAFYPITVTAYDSSNDSIWIQASRGYTRTDTIKPDVAAPGVNITAPIHNNQYGTLTGTGAAAAHAAGITAMLQEWGIVRGKYPDLYGTEIKKLLIRGAKRSKNVSYPNPIWGYGIIDILETFSRMS